MHPGHDKTEAWRQRPKHVKRRREIPRILGRFSVEQKSETARGDHEIGNIAGLRPLAKKKPQRER